MKNVEPVVVLAVVGVVTVVLTSSMADRVMKLPYAHLPCEQAKFQCPQWRTV